jgi:chromate transporter
MTGSKVSLFSIFAVFAKIGAFTIGGGYAMIPLIEAEMRRKNWISEENMPDIIVLAQSAPGILAVNMAIFSGYRLRGIRGALAATLGAVLPSFAIILAIAALFSGIRDNPVVERIFRGIRPVAVGLILVPAVNLARKGCKKWWAWLVLAASLAAVAFLKVSPIYIILVTIIAAATVSIAKEAREKR